MAALGVVAALLLCVATRECDSVRVWAAAPYSVSGRHRGSFVRERPPAARGISAEDGGSASPLETG